MQTLSIEAEQSVIGGLLLDQSKLNDVVELLTPDDFFNLDHRDIFLSMQEMQIERKPVDHLTILEHMASKGRKCDIGYIVDLSNNTPGANNIAIYAGIVKERAKKRALQSVLTMASRSISDDSEASAEQLIGRAASMIGSLQVSSGEGMRSPRDVIRSLSHQWDRRSRMGGTLDGLETGIGVLDQRYLGLKPGDLVVIGGRPSMGKSVLAANIALHNAVVHGKRGIVFSLEMTAEALIQRAVANLGGVHLDVFRRCNPEDFGRHSDQITSAAGRVAASPMILDDTGFAHINQILARARSAHRKEPLHYVVVDHINITKSDGQSREREVALITGNLKALAKELNCPVIAVTQLNRKVEERGNKRPIMSDLRDSGSIEQDADIVLLCYRDEYYNEDSPERGIIELITGKFREGETGIDRAAALLHMSRIADLAHDYRPPTANVKPIRRGLS